jgi:hypothetical protein
VKNEALMAFGSGSASMDGFGSTGRLQDVGINRI